MQRYFDQEFSRLKEVLLEMGASVERSIDLSVKGILQRETDLFKQVHALEIKINEFHLAIDEACMRLLAKQSPLATDLRFVLAAIKINADLERMGDQAVNIAFTGKRFLNTAAATLAPAELQRMANEVMPMVRESLDAFLRSDVTLARKVIENDDTVDALNHKIHQEFMALMKSDTSTVESAMDVILVAKNLERLADHATNIAEDVIFVASGQDIRHRKTS